MRCRTLDDALGAIGMQDNPENRQWLIAEVVRRDGVYIAPFVGENWLTKEKLPQPAVVEYDAVEQIIAERLRTALGPEQPKLSL